MGENNGSFQRIMATLFVALLVGFGSLCVAGYFDLDNKVSAKETDAVKEHKDIRKEFKSADDEVEKKIGSDISKIQDDIDDIQNSQTAMLIQQTRILAILEQKQKEKSDKKND